MCDSKGGKTLEKLKCTTKTLHGYYIFLDSLGRKQGIHKHISIIKCGMMRRWDEMIN